MLASLDTKISVDIDPKGRVTRGRSIRVGEQERYVILFVDGKPIPLRTIQAVELYLELGKKAGEISDMQYAGACSLDTGVVCVTIERDKVPMWPEFARKLAGSLMIHTDNVDDWQIDNPRRILQ